jgi:hypothetical protein
MSSLRIVDLSLPAARLGEENPLPPLAPSADAHADSSADPDIPPEDRRHIGWGMPATPLPYRIQDRYDRRLEPRSFTAAVLENEHLRATFLPDLGGRLWSLQSMDDGRELVFANRSFQPANLAIRNAWCAGGVEWNIGLTGHSPFTCSRIFSARADGPEGEPVLRLWEWERIRRVPFQIDVLLPSGSRALLVHVTIANPNPGTVPMYWWSNTAVREIPGMRVLAPAVRAYTFAYGGAIRGIDVPRSEGVDVTSPAAARRAVDYFFRLPDGIRPWIAAVGPDGYGLAQTSTPLLRGRKLFLWGRSPGGRRWQEYLCGPGDGYVEIQAGLARTQAEHLPMPAGARWSWTEAYAPIQASPAVVHGSGWERACDCVAKAVEAVAPERELVRMHERLEALADEPPVSIITLGTGWGALERRRRGAAAPILLPGAMFLEHTLGAEQQPWLELLEKGSFPEDASCGPPSAFMAQEDWRSLLEDSIRNSGSRNWSAWNHLGVLRAHAGEREAAAAAFRESLACRRTPWALRNLAVLARIGGDAEHACDLLREAWQEQPDSPHLTLEAGAALLAAGRPDEWLSLLERLPPDLRTRGRVLLLEGRAELALGRTDRVRAILDAMPEIPDLREGEVSLSDLWFGLQEQVMSAKLNLPVDEALRTRVRVECPPPAAIDFRVSAD